MPRLIETSARFMSGRFGLREARSRLLTFEPPAVQRNSNQLIGSPNREGIA